MWCKVPLTASLFFYLYIAYAYNTATCLLVQFVILKCYNLPNAAFALLMELCNSDPVMLMYWICFI